MKNEMLTESENLLLRNALSSKVKSDAYYKLMDLLNFGYFDGWTFEEVPEKEKKDINKLRVLYLSMENKLRNRQKIIDIHNKYKKKLLKKTTINYLVTQIVNFSDELLKDFDGKWHEDKVKHIINQLKKIKEHLK